MASVATPPMGRMVEVAPAPRPSRDTVIPVLEEQGWCLIRGAARSVEEFADRVAQLGLPLATRYGDLPSQTASGGAAIFATTPYPPSENLLFHNEAAHMPAAPRTIFFFCLTAAERGGETPLSNGRVALERLAPEIRDALAAKGLSYVRSFVPGLDVPCQRFFGTDDRAEVERICAEEGVEAEWHGEDGLETRFHAGAIARHPSHGDVFFHQIALHHPVFLDPEIRDFFESAAGPGRTPRSVRLGTGEPLPDAWALAVHQAQVDAGTMFRWSPGDMLVVDNRLVAHGRHAFAGARENFVMLGELVPQAQLWIEEGNAT